VVSRGLGRAARTGGATRRSVVAAAAYRSGERLFDTTQGKWFEFDKPDVIFKELMFPEGRKPPWDRQTLWNLVERAEKRRDAQLAREVELTLPRELSVDQQIALVRSFVRDQFVSKGMVADYAIHRPDASDGREQPHAHVLLTLRRLDPNSETGFAATKERDWNEREDVAKAVAEARKRFNDTGTPQHEAVLEAAESLRNVNIWRERWAGYANRSLETAGSAARIDHRTLEAQGIARPPLPHLGLARHVEHAYAYLKDRITQWVAIKKRTSLYADMAHYKRRDPAKLADFVLRLQDIAEDFAAQFQRTDRIPEVPLDH
jgi:MobA/MobL family protein